MRECHELNNWNCEMKKKLCITECVDAILDVAAINRIALSIRLLVRSTTKYSQPMLKHFVLPHSINRILRCARMHVGALPYLQHSHINTQPVFSFVDSLSISFDANCQIVISQWSIHCQIQRSKQKIHSYECTRVFIIEKYFHSNFPIQICTMNDLII